MSVLSDHLNEIMDIPTNELARVLDMAEKEEDIMESILIDGNQVEPDQVRGAEVDEKEETLDPACPDGMVLISESGLLKVYAPVRDWDYSDCHSSEDESAEADWADLKYTHQ